jgi:tetratricopeptide (TPR) repeat protein
MSFSESNTIEDALPPLPAHVLRKFHTPSQVVFEIEFFRGVLDRQPDYVDVLRIFGNNLSSKGRRDEALEIDRRLTHLRPEDPVARYNLACSLSLTGRIDEAIAALNEALATGYEDFDYLKEDRDLDPLRNDPRFIALLQSNRAA